MTPMVVRLFALLLAAALLAGCEKRAKMSMACQVTPARGLNCKVENLGPDAGSVCFDAVVKCSLGDHVAKICSSPLPAKKAEMKAVAALEPPVGLRETCYHAEIQNTKVMPQ
jgi:outer membrane murein-binding lipoprotein Lpp